MAVEELLLYFLLAPATAYALAALWVRRTMRAIAERELGFLRKTGATSRFFVFLALFTVPIVFGLTLLLQAQRVQETPVSDPVLRLLGWTFALAAALTVLSEAWIVVRWKAASFKDMFARVLVLTVIPETVVVWTLTICILAIGVLQRGPAEPPLSSASAAGVSLALEIMMLGSAAAPLSAFLSTRQPVLNMSTFRRVLLWTVAGDVLAVVCLALSVSQMPRT